MSEHDVITQLAGQCLNEKGQEAVADLLLENKVDIAKIYVLGAIDALWSKKQISDSEASEAYRALKIDPEEASKLRQSSPRWK
ncbi:MAG: hypothetical protein A2937_00790 [Candidatus Yonathbacteria bacterium RIFCSPLOWO2_01_FULL_47_33b]|uniref:Uncharacterized protein n=1 Tax=Candidatus Yonathbacteria bacterium RIFCSPLOWO2_01_FULL_47_33b TaxID=1802727 RepID=A0A1G2SFD2_9BACT|nr:MAG: hypothetical protein A2937_00790 [Candidatus Yonathbacteria bacterium RIFCSPLOWO2_01_FULL_47_33b]